MGGEPGRGGLLRLEKEGLFAKDRAHALAALSRDDERHDTRCRSQVLDRASRSGNKSNQMACNRTRRLDPRFSPERGWKQHRVKSAPGIEGLSVYLKTVASWYKCY